MFVNRTLLEHEDIPLPDDDWTWDDFLAICQRVTRDRDGRPDQFGFYGYTWQDAAVTSGQTLFRADGKASHFADRKIQALLQSGKMDANAMNHLQTDVNDLLLK